MRPTAGGREQGPIIDGIDGGMPWVRGWSSETAHTWLAVGLLVHAHSLEEELRQICR